MATDPAAFAAANSPGRGSAVGDFVPGKNGGWVPKDHPDAMAAPERAVLPEAAAAPAPAAAGGGGGDAGGSSVAGLAMGGLSQAQDQPSGFGEMSAPGGANPQLGQRLMPMAMRQLAALAPRIY